MARLLYRLNGVPEDEAQEIRDLLDEHTVDYYETSAGRWGISLAAIWLRDENQWQHAVALLDAYHEQRYHNARAEYERLKAAGQLEGLQDRIRARPLQMLLYLLAIGAVLAISILPFIHLLL
jgi:hypothetical protein